MTAAAKVETAFDDPVKLGALKATLIAALQRKRAREAAEQTGRAS